MSCIYCGNSTLVTVHKQTHCTDCGLSQPDRPGVAVVPLELLVDLIQMCNWVQLAPTADLEMQQLMVEQAGLVRSWAEEYVPQQALSGGVP